MSSRTASVIDPVSKKEKERREEERKEEEKAIPYKTKKKMHFFADIHYFFSSFLYFHSLSVHVLHKSFFFFVYVSSCFEFCFCFISRLHKLLLRSPGEVLLLLFP